MKNHFLPIHFRIILCIPFFILFISCGKDDGEGSGNTIKNFSLLRSRINDANTANLQLATAAPSGIPANRWTVDIDADNHGAVAFSNNSILIQGNQRFMAIDPDDGSEKWSVDNYGGRVAPAVKDGVVYLGTDGDEFFAIDVETGEVLWAVVPNNRVRSCPVIAEDLVIFTDLDNIYALNISNGSVAWGHDIFGSSSSPAYDNGKIYVGNENGSLFCYDVTTGNELWTFNDPSGTNEIKSAPAILNGFVFIGNVDGKIYKIDALSGSLIWTYATDGRLAFGSAAVAADKVYFTCSTTAPSAVPAMIVCLDNATGEEVWNQSIPGNNPGDPIIFNDQVLFGNKAGLTALDRQTGTEKWVYTGTGTTGMENQLGILDGRIIAGFSDGNLHFLAY